MICDRFVDLVGRTADLRDFIDLLVIILQCLVTVCLIFLLYIY